MRTIATLLLMLACSQVWATSQFPERIVIDRQEQNLMTEPLVPYLANPDAFQRLKSFGTFGCTALRRGYQAEWELRDKQLFLTKLFVDVCGGKRRQVPLSRLFPDVTGPVAASWFTGTLAIAAGSIDNNGHYVLVDIGAGKVTGVRSHPDVR
jgi:hypothetical protein